MGENHEQLLKEHKLTIRGALMDAYFSAQTAPWKSDCRKALSLLGVSEDEILDIESQLTSLELLKGGQS